MFKRLPVDFGKFLTVVLIGGYFIYCLRDPYPEGWHLIDSLDLIIHEAGHTILRPLGEFIHVLGGSLFQILVPFLFAGYFLRRGDPFSFSILLSWVGYNFINVSVYARDAIAMNLDLLGGEAVIHDWNYLLTETNLLSKTQQVADLLNYTGIWIIVISIITGLWFTKRTKFHDI